jgi:hypothetical protein
VSGLVLGVEDVCDVLSLKEGGNFETRFLYVRSCCYGIRHSDYTVNIASAMQTEWGCVHSIDA